GRWQRRAGLCAISVERSCSSHEVEERLAENDRGKPGLPAGGRKLTPRAPTARAARGDYSEQAWDRPSGTGWETRTRAYCREKGGRPGRTLPAICDDTSLTI